jgi:hypothetical protein
MIIWGGSGPSDTGARYDPTNDTWSPTSDDSKPEARTNLSAVWTGSGMIVWGGYGSSYPVHELDTGGIYDPGTDTWVPTATLSAPSARHMHSAVWTGTEMIVWGGEEIYGTTDTGGRYDPWMDTWTPTETTGAPSVGRGHSALWTDREMILWGVSPDPGARYDPVHDIWAPMSTTGDPDRICGAAVWTGAEMITWCGPDGGRYNPALDSWAPTSIDSAPEKRSGHTAVWSGSEMMVWGGVNHVDVSGFVVDDGGMYCADLEIDSDGDGVFDVEDCHPGDSDVWAVPGAARDLTISRDQADWLPPDEPGADSILYDLLRFNSPANLALPYCVETDTSATSAAHDGEPAPGGAYFYLVRAENSCGANLGSSSEGTPRTAGPCFSLP